MFNNPIYAARLHQHPAPEMLHVVTMISNPVRYKSRYELYRQFKQRVEAAGATLWTVEVAYGERPHMVTEPGPHSLQLRSNVELWHKENALNLLISRLPCDWKYMAWIDADVLFARPDWAVEAIHLLQHYSVLQMFSETVDMGPDHCLISGDGGHKTPGMIHQWHHGCKWGPEPYGKHNGHCGYAWAIRRDAFELLGGLIDFSVCGANDHHMARGLLHDIKNSTNPRTSPGFRASLDCWEHRAKALRLNIGFMPGVLLHHWHGAKKNRKYQERWKILVEHKFDPRTDLRRDWQGLYQLHDDGTERMRRLRDDLRAYFRQRNEDSIDL